MPLSKRIRGKILRLRELLKCNPRTKKNVFKEKIFGALILLSRLIQEFLCSKLCRKFLVETVDRKKKFLLELTNLLRAKK
jgi:hypothetical protein